MSSPLSPTLSWPIKITAITAAYFMTARLALLLAIPPGYATAVWPPAGIALGAVLIFGYRVWPGVFIGSFLANVLTSFDTTSVIGILKSMPLPICIGAGASLQALLGAFLIRRFSGFPAPLDRLWNVIKMMALGGPLSCTLNAFTGATSLLLASAIPGNDWLVNWFTWWLGDTIGVLAILPLVLAWSMELRQAQLATRMAIVVPLCLTAALIVGLFLNVRAEGWQRKQVLFERQAEQLAKSLIDNCCRYIDVLNFMNGLFTASSDVKRDDFRLYVSFAFTRHSGIQALEWIPRVPAAMRTQFEEAARSDGFPDFQIREAGPDGMQTSGKRDEYFPVYYLEPYLGNEMALGFDLASDPSRLAAMNRARDAGKTSATGRIKLIQETGEQYGVLIFMPVYGRGLAIDTVVQRRENLTGFCLGVFRLGDMVESAMAQPFYNKGITYHLYDETSVAEKQLLHPISSTELKEAESEEGNKISAPSRLQWETTFEMADRKWTIRFSPSSEYLADQQLWGAWAVLTFGLFFTSLWGVLLLVLAGRREMTGRLVDERTAELSNSNRALEEEITERQQAEEALLQAQNRLEKMVRERTAELTKTNEALRQEVEERRQGETALKASEAKYQDLYDNAPDMYVSVDASTTLILECNKTLADNLGYSKNEIIGRPIFDLYHPDCLTDVKKAFQSFVETGEIHDTRLKLRRKDGTRIDVSLNVSAVRNSEGKILYSRSSWIDISDLVKKENEIRRLNQSLEARVAERTAELEAKNLELERMNKLFVDREFRVKELRDEVARLRKDKREQ